MVIGRGQCEQGQLRRQCPQCEMAEEIQELRRELAVYREDPPVDVQIEVEPRKRKPKKRSTRNG